MALPRGTDWTPIPASAEHVATCTVTTYPHAQASFGSAQARPRPPQGNRAGRIGFLALFAVRQARNVNWCEATGICAKQLIFIRQHFTDWSVLPVWLDVYPNR